MDETAQASGSALASVLVGSISVRREADTQVGSASGIAGAARVGRVSRGDTCTALPPLTTSTRTLLPIPAGTRTGADGTSADGASRSDHHEGRSNGTAPREGHGRDLLHVGHARNIPAADVLVER